jgi:signal transduction histidine kinase
MDISRVASAEADRSPTDVRRLTLRSTHGDSRARESKLATQSGVSLTVSGDRVVVRVVDDGPGSPDSRTDEIFCRGERGLESGGTGIGLSLVHTLVSSYGREVWVAANQPRGSAFAAELQRTP